MLNGAMLTLFRGFCGSTLNMMSKKAVTAMHHSYQNYKRIENREHQVDSPTQRGENSESTKKKHLGIR